MSSFGQDQPGHPDAELQPSRESLREAMHDDLHRPADHGQIDAHEHSEGPREAEQPGPEMDAASSQQERSRPGHLIIENIPLDPLPAEPESADHESFGSRHLDPEPLAAEEIESHPFEAAPLHPQSAEPVPPEAIAGDLIAADSVEHDLLPHGADPMLFQSFSEPEIRPAVRMPHMGHVCLVAGLSLLGLVAAGLLTDLALLHHMFGVTTVSQAMMDIHYTLGSEAILYLVTFGACLVVFPMVWHKSFFAGVHWNGATAYRLRTWLIGAAVICFLLALLNGLLMPGPANTPIDKIFRAPGAAWLLFAFGVTLAPFFEEMAFRGFLLPALCTAYDWTSEKITHQPPRPLDAEGNPQWSLAAMLVMSLLTSIPFALLHGEQTGYSLGPFILLVGVSMVLCGARLVTRSLAASVLVHSCYNFLLFSIMLVGTGGFRHIT